MYVTVHDGLSDEESQRGKYLYYMYTRRLLNKKYCMRTKYNTRGLRNHQPVTTQGNVYIVCVQINKGKFSVEEATKVAQKYYGTNEAMMKKAQGLIDVCAKKGTLGIIS